MHTGFIQVGLTPGHSIGSYEYIARIKQRLAEEMPELTPYFSTGSLVDAVVNMGAAGADRHSDQWGQPASR